MTAKVKLGLRSLDAEGRIALATTIKTQMSANAATFPNPNPTMAAYNTLITAARAKVDAYNALLAQVDGALQERDHALEVMDGGTTQLAAQVENIAAGDAAKIALAGMAVRDERSPITVTKVMDVKLTASDYAGAVDSMWKPVRGAKSYELQSASDPNLESSWSYRMTSGKSSATVSGLTSGSKLWLRVRAIGAGNVAGPWSDPAEITVP